MNVNAAHVSALTNAALPASRASDEVASQIQERRKLMSASLVSTDTKAAADPAPTVQDNKQMSFTIFDVQGLLSEWGQANSAYDLNGDGTVGVADYLQMMSNLHGPGEQWVAPNVGQPASSQTPAVATSLDQDAVEPIVKPSESLAAETAQPSNAQTPSSQQVASSETASAASSSERSDRARLIRLSDSLIERLHAAGFKERPPINIHEIVTNLRLDSPSRTALLHRLQQEYGEGLGLNLKA